MQKDFLTITPDSGGGNGSLSVVAAANTGVARTSSITVSGSGVTKTFPVLQDGGGYNPSDAPNGIYIAHTDGKLYLPDNWNTAENNNAVGVALKSSNCSFIIAPERLDKIIWGGHGLTIPGCVNIVGSSTATDFEGKQNTDALVSYIGTSKTYAALYCYNYTFKNGAKGYLPAKSEIYEAYLNKTAVDDCMALIGGVPMTDTESSLFRIWTSTQNGANNAWAQDWKYGNRSGSSKNNEYCARAFTPLI